MKLEPVAGTMSAWLSEVPAFPGARFSLGFPEAIGDADATCWYTTLVPEFTQLDATTWLAIGRQPGELRYEMTVDLSAGDAVGVRYVVENESDRDWDQALAFNCLSCGGAWDVRDHDCERHWVGLEGEPTRLVEVERHWSNRPAIQIYGTYDGPPVQDLAFVTNFAATPKTVLDPWMAVESRDGTKTVATVGRPSAFLFHNMEYSCIHAASSFGPVAAGGRAEAGNDLLFLDVPFEQAFARITALR